MNKFWLGYWLGSEDRDGSALGCIFSGVVILGILGVIARVVYSSYQWFYNTVLESDFLTFLFYPYFFQTFSEFSGSSIFWGSTITNIICVIAIFQARVIFKRMKKNIINLPFVSILVLYLYGLYIQQAFVGANYLVLQGSFYKMSFWLGAHFMVLVFIQIILSSVEPRNKMNDSNTMVLNTNNNLSDREVSSAIEDSLTKKKEENTFLEYNIDTKYRDSFFTLKEGVKYKNSIGNEYDRGVGFIVRGNRLVEGETITVDYYITKPCNILKSNLSLFKDARQTSIKAQFSIYADNKVIFNKEINDSITPENLILGVKGAKKITLSVTKLTGIVQVAPELVIGLFDISII